MGARHPPSELAPSRHKQALDGAIDGGDASFAKRAAGRRPKNTKFEKIE
jgi:hypothetical protein